jgi:hypothetical protein
VCHTEVRHYALERKRITGLFNIDPTMFVIRFLRLAPLDVSKQPKRLVRDPFRPLPGGFHRHLLSSSGSRSRIPTSTATETFASLKLSLSYVPDSFCFFCLVQPAFCAAAIFLRAAEIIGHWGCQENPTCV